eukprot:TRINITY_DN3182_c0_g4_i1.p1 TRINITY_DN3182_c0_g4~~TRINITY_DN3182_c0_g4_i1.p1  ORF type:complete len:891 (-),score=239.83 TRINITY_DN3182_c0_g4_i1:241-2913(-)
MEEDDFNNSVLESNEDSMERSTLGDDFENMLDSLTVDNLMTGSITTYEIIKEKDETYVAYLVNINSKDGAYTIRRRFSAFRKLHLQLEKTFPRTSFPDFPSRSLMRSLKKTYLEKKAMELNLYICKLIDMDEIRQCRAFMSFIQQDVSERISDEHRLHATLLEHLPLETIDVKSGGTVTRALAVPAAGHMVVWEFRTGRYDIAFSAHFEGVEVHKYTRFSSAYRPTWGSFTSDGPGTCFLEWDNSYSKLRRKQLQVRMRVVSPEDVTEVATHVQATDTDRRSSFSGSFIGMGSVFADTSDISKQVKVLLTQLNETKNAFSDEQSRHQQLQNEHNELIEDWEGSQQRVSDLEESLKDTRGREEMYKLKLSKIEREKGSMHLKLRQLESKVSELKCQNNNLHEELLEARKLIQDKENTLTDKNKEKMASDLLEKELKEQIEVLQEHVETQKADFQRIQLGTAFVDPQPLNEKIETLSRQLAHKRLEMSDIKNKRDYYVGVCGNNDYQIKRLESKNASQGTVITRLRKEKKILVSEVHRLRNSVERLQELARELEKKWNSPESTSHKHSLKHSNSFFYGNHLPNPFSVHDDNDDDANPNNNSKDQSNHPESHMHVTHSVPNFHVPELSLNENDSNEQYRSEFSTNQSTIYQIEYSPVNASPMKLQTQGLPRSRKLSRSFTPPPLYSSQNGESGSSESGFGNFGSSKYGSEDQYDTHSVGVPEGESIVSGSPSRRSRVHAADPKRPIEWHRFLCYAHHATLTPILHGPRVLNDNDDDTKNGQYSSKEDISFDAVAYAKTEAMERERGKKWTNMLNLVKKVGSSTSDDVGNESVTHRCSHCGIDCSSCAKWKCFDCGNILCDVCYTAGEQCPINEDKKRVVGVSNVQSRMAFGRM